jgi:autotransporter-associated beta strand protein
VSNEDRRRIRGDTFRGSSRRIHSEAAARRLKRFFSALCAAAFLARQCNAQVLYTVTSTDGGSSLLGSLGYEIGAAAAAGPSVSDAIDFAPSSFNTPQTIALTGSYTPLAVNAGQTLTFAAPNVLLTLDGAGVYTIFNLTGPGTFGLSNMLLQNGSVAVAGGANISVATGQTTTVNATVTGSGGLGVTGPGTLVLGNASNTYLGGTTVANGTLSISNDGDLGDTSGGLAINGGTLQTTGIVNSARSVSIAGATIDTDGQADSFSNTISGTGGLTAMSSNGNGTLTLSGGNLYFGGTTINANATVSVSADANLGDLSGGVTLNGGTLQTTSGFTSNRTLALGGAGGTFDTYGQSDAFNGVISDAVTGVAGSLNLVSSIGAGTLVLGGANIYSGGTTIGNLVTLSVTSDQNMGAPSGPLIFNGGQLATAAGISSSRPITLESGGGTINTAGANDSTFSGVIGGMGLLSVSGGGSVALTGTGNTYQGGTSVSGATLVIAGDGSLGLATGSLTLDAASTLQTLGATTSSRNIAILGGATIDTDGQSDAFSGVISGGGGLTVLSSNGAGVLNLSGLNTYLGGTIVNGGTLQLGVSNALWATGSLTVGSGGTFDLNGYDQTLTAAVVNNGTIKTGLGTLTASTYGGSGTLSVIPHLSGPNLNVSGAATLGGTTLQVAGRPASGDYAIVTAGTLSGPFAGIVLPSGDTASYALVNNSLILDLTASSLFTATGQTGNQSAVGAALNAASASATGDLAAVLNQLGMLSQGQLNAALDQLGPIGLAAMRGMSFAGADANSSAVDQRLAGLHAGNEDSNGDRVAFYNAAGSQSPYPGTLVASGIGDTEPVWRGVGSKGCPWCFDDKSAPWGIFASALGTVGQLQSINGSAGYQPGYTFTSAGATMGADYHFTDYLAAGLSVGYLGGSADVSGGGGTVSSQDLRFGAYGTAYKDALHADLYVGGAEDFYDTDRNISALGRTATASPNGQEFNLDAQAGYDLKAGEAILSPFGGMSYDRLMVGSFTESGAGAMDLSVAQQTAESLRSRLGVKLAKKIKSGERTLSPYASVGWQHEYENQSRAIDAQFASAPGSSFAVNTADVSRDGALLGAGLDADWGNGLSARLSYSGDLRADFAANTFGGSVRLRF